MENCGKNNSTSHDHDASLLDDTDEDSPPSSSLLTNLQVLELLQPRIQQRQAMRKEPKKKQRRLRHRDWIEEQVVQYIRHSATIQFQNYSHVRPLQTSLQQHSIGSRKRKLTSSSDDSIAATKASMETSAPIVKSNSGDMNGSKGSPAASVTLETTKFDFTEAEAIQIINCAPRELVDLHVLVDDLPDRLTTTQQEECLSLIQQYLVPRGTSSTPPTSATANAQSPDGIHDGVFSGDSKHVVIKRESGMSPSQFHGDAECNGDGHLLDEDCKPSAR